jgi:DNA-binding NtrC family response regulator
VPIKVPSLRERKEDIHLLFRKFSSDFAEKYRSKPVVLEPEALNLLVNYRWPGNIRQLKNIAEQLSVLDEDKIVSAEELLRILPQEKNTLPILAGTTAADNQLTERDIFYKVLFELRKDLSDLKSVVFNMIQNNGQAGNDDLLKNYESSFAKSFEPTADLHKHNMKPINMPVSQPQIYNTPPSPNIIDITEAQPLTESLSIEEKEIELIKKALQKHNSKRKKAAAELGISERTLYRKIKQYDLE